MAEIIRLTIDDLLLDLQNPRLDPVASQAEALEAIVTLNHDHVRNLMNDIKENGLDPGDSLYVMQSSGDDNDYIVLDGNRRLSALKILSNPPILDGTTITDSIKKSLKRAAHGFNNSDVEPVRCVLFTDRSDAELWISRRHAGEDDGRGRITWGALEKQRFSGDVSTLDVIEFIIQNAASPEEAEEIRKLFKKSSTTLTRLLESSLGQKHLGIFLSQEDDEIVPFTHYNPDWVLRVLMQVTNDIREKAINTRKLNTEKDIEEYLNKLPKELQPSGQSKGFPLSFRKIDLRATGSADRQPSPTKPVTVGTQAPTKSKLLPKARSTLAPKKNPFKHPASEKARQLLKEAGNITIQNHRISAAFLLRAFVEFAIDQYLDDNKLFKVDKKSGRELYLKQKAEIIVSHIETNDNSMKKKLLGFKKLISGNGSPISIEGLNAFVHQDYQIPAADALIAGWDASVPVFVSTFGVP
ncbi:hypothetical protein [Acidocella sp.]|uniref:hypothetical protein n=1 Tax=Acidocella sp. TaxID=50710 RepID=UPI003D02C8BC